MADEIDIANYFEILSQDDGLIHVLYHGPWAGEQIEQIAAGALQRWKAAVDHQNGQQFIVLADYSDLDILSEWAKRFLIEAMIYAMNHGLYKVVQFGTTAMARMATNVAATRTGLLEQRSAVDNRQQADALIAQYKQELQSGGVAALSPPNKAKL